MFSCGSASIRLQRRLCILAGSGGHGVIRVSSEKSRLNLGSGILHPDARGKRDSHHILQRIYKPSESFRVRRSLTVSGACGLGLYFGAISWPAGRHPW